MQETGAIPVPSQDAVSAVGSRQLSPLAGGSERAGQTIASTRWMTAWGPALILGVLIVVLYHKIAVKLVTDWHELPTFRMDF